MEDLKMALGYELTVTEQQGNRNQTYFYGWAAWRKRGYYLCLL